MITLLLAAGNNSSGQFRFASREATQTANGILTGSAGDLAPYLSFSLPQPLLRYSLSGGGASIAFSWPGSSRLYWQTNTVGTGLNTNWVPYPDTNNPVTVPIDGTKGSVFFRLSPASGG